jgi:hypothetical protein
MFGTSIKDTFTRDLCNLDTQYICAEEMSEELGLFLHPVFLFSQTESGVCGSDNNFFLGDIPGLAKAGAKTSFPRVGHEHKVSIRQHTSYPRLPCVSCKQTCARHESICSKCVFEDK